jgi:hypothetical protein
VQFIFHIGQQKTASTAIQSHLAYNRSRLARQGVLYPSALGPAKATLITDFISESPNLAATRAALLANLEAELQGPCSRVLLSNENLFGWNPLPTMPLPLKAAFERYATSWRVMCYVRRPDEHLVSLYQQNVKGGSPNTLDQAFEERLTGAYYSYARRMRAWADAFGEDAVEVRLFHRKALKGTPFEDFARWLGLDPALLPPSPAERSNESLDRLNTEVLRLANLLKIQRPELLRGHDVKKFASRMRAVNTGDRWRLSGEQARRLQEHFREEHEGLARRYLPDEEARLLLAPPADEPPLPPLDRDALHARVMTLFGDPALARAIVEKAGQPVDPSLFRRDTAAQREAKAVRIVEQFERKSRRQRSLVYWALDGLRLVPRAGRKLARTLAGALRPR